MPLKPQDEGDLAPLFDLKALRPLGALHLTLGVMSLNEEKLEAAKTLLNGLDLAKGLRDSDSDKLSTTPARIEAGEGAAEAVSSSGKNVSTSLPTPLVISLEGLFEFNRPQKASRLLAEPVDPSHRLLQFAKAARQHFIDAGFMLSEDRELKLHATLVNTVYVRGGRGSNKRRIEFDGRDLIKLFEENSGGVIEGGQAAVGRFAWAEGIDIDRLQICEMGAEQVADEEMGQVYTVVAEKTISSN